MRNLEKLMKGTVKNKNKGITLVALVVTIIILIILAGVSISLVLGENGILQKARDAKTQTGEEQIKERIQLAYHSALVDGQVEVTEPSLENELKNEFNKSALEDGWLDKTSVEGKWRITIDGISLEVPAGKENDNNNKVVGSSSDWKLNDAKDTIVAYIGDNIDEDTFIVPNYVDDNKIISIGDGTKPIWVEKFSNPNGFMSGKKIKISEGIENIQKNAFASASGLVGDLILPDSIINMEQAAFGGCVNLNGNLYIGRNVEFISDNSFGTHSFNDLEINMKNIPDKAFGSMQFSECYFNGKLIIGNNVETIGEESFAHCKFAGGIVIPINVTAIGENAFWDCDKSKITNNSSVEGYPWGAN